MDGVTGFLTLSFGKKNSTWTPHKQAKRFGEIFNFREDIREKLCVNDFVVYAETQFMFFYRFKNKIKTYPTAVF